MVIKSSIVVFIAGESWHRHNWEQKKLKISPNRDFRIPKIERNMQRYIANNLKLEEMGLKVFRFWGYKIKKHLNGCVSAIINYANLQTPVALNKIK